MKKVRVGYVGARDASASKKQPVGFEVCEQPNLIFELQNEEASFNKTKKCNLVWIATSGSHLE